MTFLIQEKDVGRSNHESFMTLLVWLQLCGIKKFTNTHMPNPVRKPVLKMLGLMFSGAIMSEVGNHNGCVVMHSIVEHFSNK